MPKPKRNVNAVYEETLTPPSTLPPGQQIVRVKQAAGNNLYHIELASGEAMLAELEAKFRSTIWIKRGSYAVVDTSALAERDNKLGGVIVNVVRDEKTWRKMEYWPTVFKAKSTSYGDETEHEGPKMPPSDSSGEEWDVSGRLSHSA